MLAWFFSGKRKVNNLASLAKTFIKTNEYCTPFVSNSKKIG